MVLIGIQLIPYGHDHTNPTSGRAIAWDSPRTEQLMTEACMDCHSNLTRWPWYSNVAPVSWLVQHDVDTGRAELNLTTDEIELDEMIESVREGSMPPWQYKPTHPGARLSEPGQAGSHPRPRGHLRPLKRAARRHSASHPTHHPIIN